MNDLFVELCLTVPVRLRSVCVCVYVNDLIDMHTYKLLPYLYVCIMYTYMYVCMYVCVCSEGMNEYKFLPF